MLNLPTNGYRQKSLTADVSLGVFDGLDNALWCYGFASVIFAGAMAPFLPFSAEKCASMRGMESTTPIASQIWNGPSS